MESNTAKAYDFSQRWANINHLKGLTSVVDYPVRGKYGDPRYRGNISGELFADLFDFCEPEHVMDAMAGGLTVGDVCREKGISFVGLDLRPNLPKHDEKSYLTIPGFNLLKGDFPQSTKFMVLHIPYFDMVKYSVEMWNNGIQHPDDLSCCSSYNEFLLKMSKGIMNAFGALRKGGRMVIVTADYRVKGKKQIYPIQRDLYIPGVCEQYMIKIQNNCKSNSISYSGKFIPLVHEYVMIFRKDAAYVMPMRYVQIKEFDTRKYERQPWRAVVQSALEALGGESTLDRLYNEVKDHAKAKSNNNWQARVRAVLQEYKREFEAVSRGRWRLRSLVA